MRKALWMLWCSIFGHKKPMIYVRTRGHIANLKDNGEMPILIHDTQECVRCGDYRTIRRVTIQPGGNEPRFTDPDGNAIQRAQ